MKKLFLLFLFLVSLVLAQAAPPGDVTASQLNKTWKLRNNEFKIWALLRQHLQIEFLGFYEHQTANGRRRMRAKEAGRIEGDTAIFKPDGAEDACKITLKFTSGKLLVTQTGTC